MAAKQKAGDLHAKKLTVDGAVLSEGGAVFLAGATVAVDVISEVTSGAGVTIDGMLIKDGAIVAAGTTDLNGTKLIIDADADTSMTADTDDQIDFEIAGADDFRMTANTFTALSGSTIATNTIAETTAGAGVTVDSVLIKDGKIDAPQPSQVLTETGAITINNGQVQLNHDTVIIAATLNAPAVGDTLIIVDNSASGTAAHTVTLPAGVTWDGTNNTATFDAPGEALFVTALSATRWFIVLNIGSVALSNV